MTKQISIQADSGYFTIETCENNNILLINYQSNPNDFDYFDFGTIEKKDVPKLISFLKEFKDGD